MNLQTELGVQSYSLRAIKDNTETARVVKGLGIQTIELCSTHVDFTDEGSFERTIDIYRTAGVRIVSTGVNGMAGEENRERKLFEFLRPAGARYMSVSFRIDTIPESLRVAEALAEEYDVRLGIHNHGGRHWLGCSETLSWIFSQTSERIGLCLDTGWALDSGENPVKMAERFAGRLYGVHFKDFSFDSSRKPVPEVTGSGLLDLEGFLRALERVGFDGYAVIEHEAEEHPATDIEACAEAIRAAAAG